MPAEPKTLEDYTAAVKDWLVHHRASYFQIGEVLLAAKGDLSPTEYKELELVLLQNGISRNLIQVAVAAATGAVHEDLIFYAEKKERLVNLPAADQTRLLHDAFPLKREDGSIEEKYWWQMSGADRMQLVGPEANRILGPDDQEVKTKGDRRVAYEQAEMVGDTIILRIGKKAGKISLTDLVTSLQQIGELPRFLRRVQAVANAIRTDAQSATKRSTTSEAADD